MDSSRRTAILLLSLDQSTAANLLGRLSREQVERVTLAIANANQVTRSEQEAVLEAFKHEFESRPLIRPSGPEAARELLELSLQKSDADLVQERIEQQQLAGPFAFLHHRDPDAIQLLIKDERPQMIALILSQLPPDLAATTLAYFSSDFQAEIVARMTHSLPTDLGVMSEIASLLQTRLVSQPQKEETVSNAASVLRQAGTKVSAIILRDLDQSNAPAAQTIRDSLFAYRDLDKLSAPQLQEVLEQTSDCSWAIALKGAAEGLRRRILSLLPPQVANSLMAEIQAIGPLRLSEITSVQNQIAEQVYQMICSNQISISLPSPEPTSESSSNRYGRAHQASA